MSQEPETGPVTPVDSTDDLKPAAAAADTQVTAVDPVLRPVLKVMDEQGVPQEAQAQVIRAVVRAYRGPLPPPEMLKAYGDACEGGAERIMVAFEQETAHRQELEKLAGQMELEALRANIGFAKDDQRLAARGQWIAAALATAFGVFGSVLGMYGHEWLAGILFSTTIGAVFAAYVIGARQKKDAAGSAADTDEAGEEGDA